MWQRFSEKARRVVFQAQEAAQCFGQGYVSTEHLLHGILQDETNTACKVLTALGFDMSAVLSELKAEMPASESDPGVEFTLAPLAKRAIDLAYEEARRLGNNYIGTEHLLLALIREGTTLAAALLAKVGVEEEMVRAQAIEIQAAEREGRPASTFAEDPGTLALSKRSKELRRILASLPVPTQSFISERLITLRNWHGVLEFFAVVLLSEPHSSLQKTLALLEVEPATLLSAIEMRLLTFEEPYLLAKPPTLAQVLAQARFVAGDQVFGPEHIFLALMQLGRNGAAQIMSELGVTPEEFQQACKKL